MSECSSAPGAAAGPYRILLLAALPQEVRPFLRQTRARRRRGLPWPAWEFAAGAVRGLLALSGMGQAAAAGGRGPPGGAISPGPPDFPGIRGRP